MTVFPGAGALLSFNLTLDTILPLAHPPDIAAAIVRELQTTATSKDLQYIVRDYRRAAYVARAIGTPVEKTELSWIAFTEQQTAQGMQQAGLPAEIAALYVAVGNGLAAGKLQQGFLAAGAPVNGSIRLEDFAKEFA